MVDLNKNWTDEVVSLPFRITEFDEDMLVGLDRNFSEIVRRLAHLQRYMKLTAKPGMEEHQVFIVGSIIYGLDADKPVLG